VFVILSQDFAPGKYRLFERQREHCTACVALPFEAAAVQLRPELRKMG
jgi:hypothetical protein